MNQAYTAQILNHVSLLALLTLPVSTLAQNSYRTELNAEYEQTDYPADETKIFALGAEIFLKPVNTGSHPYAEAAFLEHASSLSIVYLDFEYSSSAFTVDETDILLAAYIIPDNTPLILEIAYGQGENDISNLSDGFDIDYIGVGIGTYIDNQTTLLFDYLKADLESTGGLLSNVTVSITNIVFKHVEILGGATAYNAEISVTSSESKSGTTIETNTIVELEGDYYLDQATSIGANLEMNSGDDAGDEGITLGVDFRIFVTPTVSVSAGLSQFSADNTSGEDSDTLTLGAAARF